MNTRTVSLLAILLLVSAALTSAEKAYTWTDENGTVHFSEDPPFDETITADQIELLPAPSAGNIGGENDFYSVANQADRMEKKRLENEKLIAERLQAESESKKINNAQPTRETTAETGVPIYPRYYPSYPQYTKPGAPPLHHKKPRHKNPDEPDNLPRYKPKASMGN